MRLSQTDINFHFTGSASTTADDDFFFVFLIPYKTYILQKKEKVIRIQVERK